MIGKYNQIAKKFVEDPTQLWGRFDRLKIRLLSYVKREV